MSRDKLTWPVYQSMAAAAGAIHVPLSVVTEAKRQGCRAFIDNGCVDMGILVPFINDMAQTQTSRPDGFASWKEFLEAERGKRESIRRKKDEGMMMPTAEAQRQAQEAMALTFSELDRRDRELPPALAGLSAVDIYKRMTGDTESLRRNLKLKFETIAK